MIIPSIDLMEGRAVQLVGGREKVLDAGEPHALAERFGRVGEIAVIDLDAAMGRGSNTDIIRELVRIAPCRVGGGIRSVASAIEWLDAGASKVILGTMAVPEVLEKLPRGRVIVALDALQGEVVVEGWRKKTGARLNERMQSLRGLADNFLVTFVEHEGRMQGTALQSAAEIVRLAKKARVTFAGGITTCEEIASLDGLDSDAQVGMALYTGRLGLADAFAAAMRSDRPDGLWPTVVCDERGSALGLAFSDLQSLSRALELGRGVYHSRSRGLWIKGDTSGATQQLLRVKADCDRDCLLFEVRQNDPGFCHLATRTCWGPDRGLGALSRRLARRVLAAPPGSYTARLLSDPALLEEKLGEEAGELAEAGSPEEVTWEAADLMYFTLVAMARAGVSLAAVEAELDRRALRVSRRYVAVEKNRGPQPGAKCAALGEET